MRAGGLGTGAIVFGLCWLGGSLWACAGESHACDETRTCPVPVGFIDAGIPDDSWSFGGAEASTASDGMASNDAANDGQGAGAGATEPGDVLGVGGARATREDVGIAAAGAPEPNGAAPTGGPRLLSVSPADGATGVTNDSVIVLRFSAPIAAQAFEAAYESADLPPSALAFTWNAARTVLTLKPISALSYEAGQAAAGAAPEFPAKTYAYGFRAFSCDEQGHVLPAARFAFSTLREVSAQVLADPVRTGNWTQGEGEGVHNCVRNAAPPYTPAVCVGDDSNNVRYTGFLSFDIGSLPANIAAFSRARVLADAVLYGSTERLGASTLEHVSFSALGDAALSAPGVPLGPFYGGVALASGTRFELSEDVTSAVAEDYGRRTTSSSLTQYRLGFASLAANYAWDDIELTTAKVRLAVTYLLP